MAGHPHPTRGRGRGHTGYRCRQVQPEPRPVAVPGALNRPGEHRLDCAQAPASLPVARGPRPAQRLGGVHREPLLTTSRHSASDLDEAAMGDRESMIRSALKRAANPADQLEAPDAERAVAAAALVVAQHPDGEATCSNYGPSGPMPQFPADLRMLAIDALDQVVAEPSELAELWDEATNGQLTGADGRGQLPQAHPAAARRRRLKEVAAATRGGRGRGRPCRAVPRAQRHWPARRGHTWRPPRTGP
ncbi:DUF4259 domain-containing protein [Streptomyces sp. NBC_00057]|uniref:DUF4259 domain-containing protein n=1 Tax=Streptomyces sp. NBC_00057 TaxID=2975634 RepID=UPI003243D17E